MIRHVFVISVLISLLPLAVEGGETTLNILYTGSLNGELEPCGCSPKTDFGGLARMSGYILRNKNSLYPYVLIDAGNFSDRDSAQGRMKAEAALKAFSIMKYDAVGFMNREKSFSNDFFVSMIQSLKVPFVSDSYPCKRSVSVNRGALEVVISASPEGFREGALNVLVTDKPAADLTTADKWDVIISSSGEILDAPVQMKGSLFVSGYPRGKNLGILTLSVDGEGRVKKFKHRFEALGPDIKEDALVRDVLDEYDANVAALLKTERPPAGSTYLGVAECGKCHQTFVESWEQTRHAGAFASLQKTGKAEDPECIICHSVGFGEEGGFYTIDTTPDLANVQCEECHGLDREHVTHYEKPMRRVTVSVCLKCHTQENSPDFDYEKYLKKVIH